MREKMPGNAYLLYAHPIPGARTGHCAFVVTDKNFLLTPDNLHTLTDEKVEYYFSMYPNLTPDQIRKTPYTTLAKTGLPPFTVSSYTADLIMRGQSRDRFNRKEKEEVNITDLIATLPAKESELGEKYFTIGQYDSFIKLPAHLNLDKTVETLEQIRTGSEWGMFSPLPQHLTRNPNIQNCCSAVRHALKIGGVDLHSSISIMQLPAILTLALWTLYLGTLLLAQEMLFSEDTSLDNLFLAPVAYASIKLAIGLNEARQYFQNLKMMAKDPNKVPPTLRFPIYATCILLNAMFCLWRKNAVSASFVFPSQLFSETKKVRGAEAYDNNVTKLGQTPTKKAQ